MPDNYSDTQNEQPVKVPAMPDKFPFTEEDRERLMRYNKYRNLFLGNHFDAFNMTTNGQVQKDYGKLRYVQANFAGLISRIVADMLFSEPVTIKCPKGDQDFIDAVVRENQLHIQFYESALSNSFNGDGLFKLRVGKRHPNDEKMTVIIEETSPHIYFPHINGFNVRQDPEQKELAWIFDVNDKKYLRREVHEPGKIYNYVFEYSGGKIGNPVDLAILNDPDILPVVDTKIDRSLLIHVPNWRIGGRYFGLSDYIDLESLFFAIDSRMTKIDNILDNHSDPILMVPPGVLDENGKVRKKDGRIIEYEDGESGEPKYIVWDASLENAFKEVEKLVEFLYMVGEVSPDVLGLGQGQSDSGRALKFKLIRTIAKVARKKLYYDAAIKEIMYVAQLLAKEWNLDVDDVKLTKEVEDVEIDWADGLPIDNSEQIDTEIKAVDAGLTTKKASMMRIWGVDEKQAEKMIADEQKENALSMPASPLGGANPFDKKPVDNVNPNVNKPTPPPAKGK